MHFQPIWRMAGDEESPLLEIEFKHSLRASQLAAFEYKATLTDLLNNHSEMFSSIHKSRERIKKSFKEEHFGC